MLKKAISIFVSVALSFCASTALAGQKTISKKKIPPAATAPEIKPAPAGASTAPAAQSAQAVKASKKIQLTKDRAIIQRKGPGHVA